MVCPRCGSDNIEVELDEDGLAYFEECLACGYTDQSVECRKKFSRDGMIKNNNDYPMNLRIPINARLRLPKLRLHDN